MVHLCGKRYAQRAGETTEIRVYSNQETVALYLNGKLAEEKSAEKVFVFNVTLKEGFNLLLAKAGEVKDTMTLEKVDEEPAIYHLPIEDNGQEGVANWFTQLGDMELPTELTFPEGKLSIKSTLGAIHKNEAAWNMLVEMMKLPISPTHGMWDMVKNFDVQTLMEMGGELPEGVLPLINAKLNEFDEM